MTVGEAEKISSAAKYIRYEGGAQYWETLPQIAYAIKRDKIALPKMFHCMGCGTVGMPDEVTITE